jgi:putative ABC transport system permease protein
MTSVALKMLFGDRAKLLGLVLGVAFATLLIAQQSSLFVGLMMRSQNTIADAQGVEIWVMDPSTEQVDLIRPMHDAALFQVRGVAGVAWAVPLFKAAVTVKTSEGRLRNAVLLGLDDVSLIGATRRFLMGSLKDLRRPDSIAIDRVGYKQLWPDEPLTLGKTLELNDRRAIITAITDAAPAFSAQAIIYTRYSQAVGYIPMGRGQLSFIQARAIAGLDPAQVAQTISKQTGLKAYAADDFARRTIAYNLRKTGIPINFATTIMLGLIVGSAVAGLIFNNFISDNLKQFATLKVVGVTNARITGMVLCQVGVAGAMGFSIGVGLAAAFFEFACTSTSALRGFILPWWIVVATAAVMTLSILLSTARGLRRVLMLDPGIVLRS